MLPVGGADQGEIVFIRDRKDNPPVFALKEIAFVVVIQPLGDDVTAPDQPHTFVGFQA